MSTLPSNNDGGESSSQSIPSDVLSVSSFEPSSEPAPDPNAPIHESFKPLPPEPESVGLTEVASGTINNEVEGGIMGSNISINLPDHYNNTDSRHLLTQITYDADSVFGNGDGQTTYYEMSDLLFSEDLAEANVDEANFLRGALIPSIQEEGNYFTAYIVPEQFDSRFQPPIISTEPAVTVTAPTPVASPSPTDRATGVPFPSTEPRPTQTVTPSLTATPTQTPVPSERNTQEFTPTVATVEEPTAFPTATPRYTHENPPDLSSLGTEYPSAPSVNQNEAIRYIQAANGDIDELISTIQNAALPRAWKDILSNREILEFYAPQSGDPNDPDNFDVGDFYLMLLK